MLFVIVVDNQVRPIADRPPHTETKRSIALEQIHMSANDSSRNDLLSREMLQFSLEKHI